MEYQDFELTITQEAAIEAESSQGEERGRLGVDLEEVDLAIQLVEHRNTNAELLKSLGSHLFEGVFAGDILAHLRASQAAAEAVGAGLRLRMILESPSLAALPWEFLFDEDRNAFLANTGDLVLSRYLPVPIARRDIPPLRLPLRILLVVSAPEDQAPLDSQGEVGLIEAALADRLETGEVALEVLQEPTVRAINQKLREKEFHVFHFIGHAAFQADRGQVALVDENRQTRWLDEEAFSNFFLGYRSLGLVVLNACQGATLSAHKTFRGLAPHLVRRGIPAVIAMQYPIPDGTAKIFADELYRTLSLGWPVDQTVQTTRNAIAMEAGLDRPDFATPVLFMRARDGRILENISTNG